MSCAYRHTTTRIATMAGIPRDLMLTAMDIARQRRVTFPALPPDRLRTITQLLGITPTCGNPQQVIDRIQTALIALGTLHPTHPCIERWMAVAALLGVPEDHLPVPVHPDVLATVRAQWAAPPPDPAPDRTTAGIAALWRGDPIPAELIEEAVWVGDRQAIVTWMAHGVWDEQFTDVCRRLTTEEIGTIVRAGVITDALVERIARQWLSDDLPWDVFSLAMWDRVTNPKAAHEGRARTAAAKLVRNPAFRDDQLIAAVAQDAHWASKVLRNCTDLSDDRLIDAVAKNAGDAYDVLTERHDLRDPRLIAAVAKDSAYAQDVLLARPDLRTERCLIEAAAEPDWWAYDVLIKHPDQYTDERLITIAAQRPRSARDVLIKRTDLCDPRLIAAVTTAEDATYARDVLIKRTDLSDPLLIDAVAVSPWDARDVLIKRTDLSDDRLIAAVAKESWCAGGVLIARTDLRDDRLIAAIAAAKHAAYARGVLIARPDLSDDRLIITVAESEDAADARDVLLHRADLRTDMRLLAAIARNRAMVDVVLAQHPDLYGHPLIGTILD